MGRKKDTFIALWEGNGPRFTFISFPLCTSLRSANICYDFALLYQLIYRLNFLKFISSHTLVSVTNDEDI